MKMLQGVNRWRSVWWGWWRGDGFALPLAGSWKIRQTRPVLRHCVFDFDFDEIYNDLNHLVQVGRTDLSKVAR